MERVGWISGYNSIAQSLLENICIYILADLGGKKIQVLNQRKAPKEIKPIFLFVLFCFLVQATYNDCEVTDYIY